MERVSIRRAKAGDGAKSELAGVHERVQQWALDRSRDETEQLRRREAAKLVSGLEKMSLASARSEDESSFVTRKRNECSGSSRRVVQSEAPLDKKQIENSNARDQSSNQSTQDADEPMSTPVAAKNATVSRGGMHFRNQLPANYTPTRKSSSHSASTRGLRDSSSPTRIVYASSKPADVSVSDFKLTTDERPSAYGDDKASNQAAHAPTKFQAFFPASNFRPGISSASTTTLSRKTYPVGTVPQEPETSDPEAKHMYSASAMRRAPEWEPTSHSASTGALPGNERRATTRQPRASSASVSSRSVSRKSSTKSVRTGSTADTSTGSKRSSIGSSFEATTTAAMSELRREQMDEIDKIRRLFEKNQLEFSARTFERGLLVPEDRPVLASIRDLPLPGSRLGPNPMAVSGKTSKTGRAKKKLKKKKVKAGGKKGKKLKSPTKKAKSPTKKG